MEAAGSVSTRRAQRFAMALPIKYRAGSERSWSEAVTLNASRTGVLVWPAGDVAPGRHVEVLITLPECDVFPRARVRCAALVVRAGFDGLALEIEHYRFLKPDEDGEHHPKPGMASRRGLSAQPRSRRVD